MPLAVRVALLRRLARRDLSRFGPPLAEALVTRSRQVSVRSEFVARRTASAEEAVALYRRLEQERPGRFRVGLARALVARSWVPDDETVGAALERGREAIGHVRDATDRPALVALAEARLLVASLTTHSATREALPLADAARAAWRRCEPLDLRERMSLVRTLLVIGDCRARLDRQAEALAVRQDALDRYRALSFRRRARWAPTGWLAMVGLADSMAALGRHTDAVALADEARSDLDFVVRLLPRRAHALLGQLLQIVAQSREALGETEEARRAAEEAVGHQRWLVTAHPGRYEADLAVALRTLAVRSVRAGDPDDALAPLREAVELARDVDDDALVPALLDLSDLRYAAGERAEAESLLAEAVARSRVNVDDLPEVWRPRLARALRSRCEREPADGSPTAERWAAAVAAGREAVELHRKLAGADGRYRAELASTLAVLARAVDRAGNPDEADDLRRECETIRRELDG
ncbi:hypothetical protein [Micromonospora sp. WMMD812]|uniref:hypothetical protein n=1 Tax=Micromonospora sp. WMMD812 TaxID=3015152 RepID=UPI00248CD60A|nr:hypothetical protein [Micromonospora sp. WMMD812]WBB70516.1 hypothetical protein O7603_14665 [Micromonospora sp. WMMD812]